MFPEMKKYMYLRIRLGSEDSHIWPFAECFLCHEKRVSGSCPGGVCKNYQSTRCLNGLYQVYKEAYEAREWEEVSKLALLIAHVADPVIQNKREYTNNNLLKKG